MEQTQCPECGADWSDGQTCTDHFHLMLAWELDYQLYDVHHLLVVCYHLQHPTLYSPEGLGGAKKLLVEFVEDSVSPQAMRQKIAKSVASGTRKYKIKGTSESHGIYEKPIEWSMVAADITQAGIDKYYECVRQWAETVLHNLRESDNLE